MELINSTSEFGSADYRKLYSALVRRLYVDLKLSALGVEADDISAVAKHKAGPRDFASCEGVAGANLATTMNRTENAWKSRCAVVDVVIFQVANKGEQTVWWTNRFATDLAVRASIGSLCQKRSLGWKGFTFEPVGCHARGLATEFEASAVFLTSELDGDDRLVARGGWWEFLFVVLALAPVWCSALGILGEEPAAIAIGCCFGWAIFITAMFVFL